MAAATDHGTLGAALVLEAARLPVQIPARRRTKARGNATDLGIVDVTAGGASLLQTVGSAGRVGKGAGGFVAAEGTPLHAGIGRASRQVNPVRGAYKRSRRVAGPWDGAARRVRGTGLNTVHSRHARRVAASSAACFAAGSRERAKLVVARLAQQDGEGHEPGDARGPPGKPDSHGQMRTAHCQASAPPSLAEGPHTQTTAPSMQLCRSRPHAA